MIHYTSPYSDQLSIQGSPMYVAPASALPPPDMDIFKLIQLGPHCTGTLRRHVQTCSLWRTHLASYWNAFLFYLTLMYDKFESLWLPNLITVCNEVAKVMFLHLSVILFTAGCYPSMHCRWYHSIACSRYPGGGLLQRGACSRGGACSWGGACSGGSVLGVPAPGGMETPVQADGYCCGRYACYWNAFLLAYFDEVDEPTDLFSN